VPDDRRRLAVRAIRGKTEAMRGGWVYMMTDRPNGTLYIGVTSDLARRAGEHRRGIVPGFTKLHGESQAA
jgi:putative endonuclease